MGNLPNSQSLDELRLRSAELTQDICQKYGVYSNVIYYSPSPIAGSDRNRPYVIAGLDPAIGQDPPPSWLRPDEIIRNSKRNQKLFYPKAWAYDLSENPNGIQVRQDLVTYCSTAEFLSRLYGEYGAALPDKLRVSEINPLIEYRTMLDNPEVDDAQKRRCRKALDAFFKEEMSKSRFRQKWRNYYRSEHFPDRQGAIGRLVGYWKRNKNQTTVKRLMDVNGDLHKLELQEHEYKYFVKLMQEKHPDVIYAAGEKDVVDHGLVGRTTAFGRAVTGEEYAAIRKDRFAKEGFAAVADLRPAYWEFRDVYYKAADEPLVAGVYNQIALSYAKCNPLMDMRERGDLRLTKIPAADFMNFVSLAKANNLRFYIDNDGDFANPSLEMINVIYNGHQEEKLQGITERMVHDKIEFSHLLDVPHSALAAKLQSIESRKQEKLKAHTPHSHTR